MTVRTDLVAELFARCRDGRPSIDWSEGFPGADPSRELVWLSNMVGQITIPVINATPLTVQDDATITLSADCATGGLDRLTAMANVEAWLTDVIRIVAYSPELNGAVDGTISLVPTDMRGPYSQPNTVEAGFMASAELDLEFSSRPQ